MSPLLRICKQARDQLDDQILRDLEGLGWDNRDALIEKILEQRDDGQSNLETIFYQLIASRNIDRVRDKRSYSPTNTNDLDGPDSPGITTPYSPRTPTPASPSRRSSVQVVAVNSPARLDRAASVETPDRRASQVGAVIDFVVNYCLP